MMRTPGGIGLFAAAFISLAAMHYLNGRTHEENVVVEPVDMRRQAVVSPPSARPTETKRLTMQTWPESFAPPSAIDYEAQIDAWFARYQARKLAAAGAQAGDRQVDAGAIIAGVDAKPRTTATLPTSDRREEIETSRAPVASERDGPPMPAAAESSSVTPDRMAAAPASDAYQCASAPTTFDAVEFARARRHVDRRSKPTLDKLVAIAKRCSNLRIEIHGHADATGWSKANWRLSERRARSVAAYLVAHGIDARRLETVGHGAAMPRVPNDNAENRARNRRTEFTLKASEPAVIGSTMYPL